MLILRAYMNTNRVRDKASAMFNKHVIIVRESFKEEESVISFADRN